MNNRQTAKQKVIRAALATLLEKKALWDNLPTMAKDVADLATVKEELETGAQAQAATPHGASQAQQASRKELRRLTRCASRLLVYYAQEIDANELAGNARVNDTMLLKGTLGEVLAEGRRMEALVKAHPQAFVGSFKDPEFVATFSQAITAYEAVMGKPRLVVVTRAAATDQVEKAFRRGQRLLLKLDALVGQFEDEDPEFVTAWKFSCKGRAPQRQAEAETPADPVTPAPEAKAA